MSVKNGVSRTENARVTSSGARTLVRYKSLPTRESLRLRSPKRTQHTHNSRPSKNVVPWKKTVSLTIWKVSNIWIVTQNTSRQGTAHVARHYCQVTVYYPIPSSPSTHNRVLSLKIPKYLGPQNRISLVLTKYPGKQEKIWTRSSTTPLQIRRRPDTNTTKRKRE